MLKSVQEQGIDGIIKAIRALPLGRKKEVLNMLEEELFAARFKTLLKEFRKSARNYPLSLEEISREVETVRTRRHESRN